MSLDVFVLKEQDVKNKEVMCLTARNTHSKWLLHTFFVLALLISKDVAIWAFMSSPFATLYCHNYENVQWVKI